MCGCSNLHLRALHEVENSPVTTEAMSAGNFLLSLCEQGQLPGVSKDAHGEIRFDFAFPLPKEVAIPPLANFSDFPQRSKLRQPLHGSAGNQGLSVALAKGFANRLRRANCEGMAHKMISARPNEARHGLSGENLSFEFRRRGTPLIGELFRSVM